MNDIRRKIYRYAHIIIAKVMILSAFVLGAKVSAEADERWVNNMAPTQPLDEALQYRFFDLEEDDEPKPSIPE